MGSENEVLEPYAVLEHYIDDVCDMRIIKGSFRCTLVSIQKVPGRRGDHHVAQVKIIMQPTDVRRAITQALKVLGGNIIDRVLGREIAPEPEDNVPKGVMN
jgi:hypothetical protein